MAKINPMELTAGEADKVIRDAYADQSRAQKRKYGDPPGRCIGVALPDRHAIEIAELKEQARQRAYQATGRGCGKEFMLGWAGNSPVRCGAILHDLSGSTSILRCPECETELKSV